MDYRNLTVEECMEHYKQGWAVILHNGRVLGFQKEKAHPSNGNAPMN